MIDVLKLQCPICLKEQDVYPYISTYTCSKYAPPNKHSLIWFYKDFSLELPFLNIGLDDALSISIDEGYNRLFL